MIKKCFSSDASYQEVKNFEVKDALMAVVLYIISMVLLLLAGIIHTYTSISGYYASIAANVLMIFICAGFVAIRKQKRDSVGLNLNHFVKALLLGLVVGIIFSLLNIIPAIQSGGKLTTNIRVIFLNAFYYLVIIGFEEELLFRGYIQTRLYGAIKSDVLAVIAGGLIFATTHIPFQLYIRNNGSLIEFLANNYTWLLLTFIYHIVFNFLYRKFNSLTAPVAAHWLMNFSYSLIS